MRFSLLLLLSVLSSWAIDPIRELGQMWGTNRLGWDHFDDPGTNTLRFKIWVGSTNWQEGFTNINVPITGFTNIGSTPNLFWPGNANTNLNGIFALYVTAYLANTGEESVQSEVVQVPMRAGLFPPRDIMFYQFMQAIATYQPVKIETPPILEIQGTNAVDKAFKLLRSSYPVSYSQPVKSSIAKPPMPLEGNRKR